MLVSRPRDSWDDPHSEAMLALRNHLMDDFTDLVNELPSAAVLDAYQENLLHKCVRLCHVHGTMIMLMWKHNQPDINGQNVHGETPLHMALQTLGSGNVLIAQEATEIVLMLINANTDLFLRDVHGNTPFGMVGKMPNCPVEIVLKVYRIVTMQNPNMPELMVNYGWSLSASFHMKNAKLIKRMLELCPDLLKPSSDGKKQNELLHLALEAECELSVLKMLLDLGDLDVNANFNGQTPLHVAAAKNYGTNNYPHISLLLDYGANPRVLDYQGMTPIQYTVRFGSPKVFELLLAAGSKKPYGAVHLWLPHTIHLASANGHVSIMRHLLTRINIESKCCLGRTPLHYAARERNAKAVYYLLAAGAKVDTLDDNGWSALHHVVRGGDNVIQNDAVPVIGLLLHFGANVEQLSSDRLTAFYIALEEPNDRVIYQLIRHIALQDHGPEKTASQIMIEKIPHLFKLYRKCLEELENLSKYGAANDENYLQILQCTRKELILVASGTMEVSYLDLEEGGGVKFVSKNFSPAAFPIYGNFFISRIHHANLELMTLEEVGEINDFNFLSKTLALSAGEFVGFFQPKYLL